MSKWSRAGRLVARHRRPSAIVLAVVVVGAGVGSYFAVSSGDSPAAATAAGATAATTTTQTVSTGTIRQLVSATGTLAPAVDDSLSFSSSGVVTSVSVAEGQSVTKGQALATINSASLAATAAQANATVASDAAKITSDEDNSASAAQLAADEAALTAAKNQLSTAQTALAGATLRSPITGVVASVGLTVGASVSGSSSGGGASSGGTGGTGSTSNSSTTSSSSGSIEVISTNSWTVSATVDATSVDLIKAGDQAQLTITGATGTVYGTISSVAVISSSTSGTATYPVVIAVTGSPTGLHDGESVTAALIYKQLSNVIVIPTTALHRTSAGGAYVDQVVNGKTVQTTVVTGISSGTETQITSGLAAGDSIKVETLPTRTGGSTTTGTGRTGTGTTTGTGGTGTGFGGGFGGGTGGGPGAGGFGGGAGGTGGGFGG